MAKSAQIAIPAKTPRGEPRTMILTRCRFVAGLGSTQSASLPDMYEYVDAPSIVAAISVLLAVAAALIVLLALRKVPERGRVLVAIGAAFALGFAAMAGAGLAEYEEPDHSVAMEACIYSQAMDYPYLTEKEATALAKERCEKQLADEPGSFDWRWLT